MLSALRGVSVYAHSEPCDMRKSFNTLAALVEGAMKRDIATGDFIEGSEALGRVPLSPPLLRKADLRTKFFEQKVR